jgi:hypothetical protein
MPQLRPELVVVVVVVVQCNEFPIIVGRGAVPVGAVEATPETPETLGQVRLGWLLHHLQ